MLSFFSPLRELNMLSMMLRVILAMFVGGIVGALLLSKIKGNAAKIIFALVLVAGGIRMLIA